MTWRVRIAPGRRSAGRRLAEALRGIFLRHTGLKFLSLVVASSVWFFVNASARDTETGFAVPLELRNRPTDLVDVSPRVEFADIRVSGPRALLNRIDRDRLAIVLDLAGVRPGPAVFRLQTDRLELPRGVKVVRLTPSEVTFNFARLARRSLPVLLTFGAKPHGGLKVAGGTAEPDTVEVSGPEEDVKSLKAVETLPIDLSDAQPGVVERDVVLEPSHGYVSYAASTVRVRIEVEESEETRVLKSLPVAMRNGDARATVVPERVDVAVRGPRSAVRSLELPPGAVYIDAAGREAGEHRVAPSVELPAGIELSHLDPEVVRLRIVRERRKAPGR